MRQAKRPRIVLGKGPRACEQALQDILASELESLGVEALQRPLYLLVPSHSLRHHLLERLARQRLGTAGVGCFTLRSLAREVLERHGETPAQGSWMIPILVQRAARQQPSLRSSLDHLHDGYATLTSTVTDLLEAGLDVSHTSALDEVLAEEGRLVASVAEVQRARSLVRVAGQVQEEMAALGLGHASALLQRATELLRTPTELELSSSGFHIYGFADATGVATDLIEAVLLRFGGTVYLDHPPDPADPELEDPSFEFSRRFATRLTDLGRQDDAAWATSEPPQIDLVAALGSQAEVRETGWRIRRLLDDGVRPEEIGVVARQLEPYRSQLRAHFTRLGVPYSALAMAGPLLPRGRRIRALLEILNGRQRVRLERWLDARVGDSGTVPDFDLRLAMFGLGVSYLDELAELPLEDLLDGETYGLPVRLGFAMDDDEELRLPRRHVPSVDIRLARDQGRELCELFASWSGDHTWSGHLEFLRQLLLLLGWKRPDPATAEIEKSVDRLTQDVPESIVLGLDEFAQTLTRAFVSLGSDRLGGQGAGVQMLDVTEARGRTFGHLFVLGMNKGMFPRPVREDPALADNLRRALGRQGHGVLPDLPLKLSGFAEERFLFAQLCSASPRVTLSWQIADDENREVTSSPLVERLLGARQPVRVAPTQTVTATSQPSREPRIAYESAIRAALTGSTRQLLAALAAAQPGDLSVPPVALSQARIDVLSELDRPSGEGSRLGPYFGFIGAATDPTEPRLAQPLYVTTLERFAVCPWQTFLERLLRLEALPDPVEALPALDSFLTGQLVHRVLERLVLEPSDAGAATLDEARTTEPVELSWPDPESLHRLVRRQSLAVARSHGINWEGFADVLAQIALPFLDQARALLWLEPGEIWPAAVELDCSLTLDADPGQPALHFQVDRVDRSADRLILSDYKTGRRAVSEAKTEKTRHQHLLAEIRKGRLLQAAAYARASGTTQDSGRYVYLHPGYSGPQETRIVSVAADEEAAQVAFQEAVDTLLAAWYSGIFFPRLVEPDTDREPWPCESCGVAEACVRGDSGARGRLRDWSARRQPRDPLESAFLDAWLLASTKEARS